MHRMLLALAMFATADTSASTVACDRTAALAASGKPYVLVQAAPGAGFNYPYVFYVPSTNLQKPFDHMLVEPNNSGFVSDDLARLTADAVRLATGHSLGGEVAERLGAPILVPVFPRPSEHGSNLYVHSLSRETIMVNEGPLRRVDLQLIAMIRDAQSRLSQCGLPVQQRVLMTGFSASGMFASRFVFLHPAIVASAAFGGINGFVMLPRADMDGQALKFPLGLADYRAITGYEFPRTEWNAVPQIAMMGENDNNDAADKAGDAYSAEEVSFIHKLGPDMMPERWNAVRAVYANASSAVYFKTYDRLGHGLDERFIEDVVAMFRSAAAKR